jgi:hypothetical protein
MQIHISMIAMKCNRLSCRIHELIIKDSKGLYYGTLYKIKHQAPVEGTLETHSSDLGLVYYARTAIIYNKTHAISMHVIIDREPILHVFYKSEENSREQLLTSVRVDNYVGNNRVIISDITALNIRVGMGICILLLHQDSASSYIINVKKACANLRHKMYNILKIKKIENRTHECVLSCDVQNTVEFLMHL